VTACRRTRRRRGQVPALPLLAVAAAALGALALVDVLAHVWPVLLAAAVLGAYAPGRRRAIPSPRPERERQADGAERERLAAEVDRLTAELDGARESAALAWDAAAEQPPRPADVGPADDLAAARRRRLLADPLSGARPLGGAS